MTRRSCAAFIRIDSSILETPIIDFHKYKHSDCTRAKQDNAAHNPCRYFVDTFHNTQILYNRY